MIRFVPQTHDYLSLDPAQSIDWIGITGLVDAFTPQFNPIPQSIKCSRNPRSKWYGMNPEKIRAAWEGESQRSLQAGTWYHNREETNITSNPTYRYNGTVLNVFKPIIIGDEKHAPPQTLQEGYIYPEHLAYLQSEGICGQSDRVEVVNGRVCLHDYKTAKAIKEEGFRNWEGITERMLDPISHLDNCNMVHYSLQLSLYLYMILKHNPLLRPGTLTLDHIIFEQESVDKYGYPIYKTTDTGDFIIKEIRPYNISYLKTEVISILSYLKDNREEIKSRIASRAH